MSAWNEDDVATTIRGLFQINAKIGDLVEHLAAIRWLLEEDDERGDEEED